jgi:endonuclease-8
MPEGPEIKRAADIVSAAIVGKHALLVEFAFSHLRRHGNALTGRKILSVSPRGKALLTSFSGGQTIYSHNQLYGEWAVLPRGAAPHPTKQIRLAIHTDTSVAVLYSASSIDVIPTRAVDLHPYVQKLGVELLDPSTTHKLVLAHITAPRFLRKSLAALLLDQGFLAGIGNYLRSEILFAARIPPNVRIADLTNHQKNTLAASAMMLTRQSYRTHGITNDVSLAQRLKKQGWTFGRYRHWVFDRAGEQCHVCRSTIERQDIGGRGLYWCPRCQPGSSTG